MTRVPRMRPRFWLEVLVVIASLTLWVATLIWPDWIELVFKVDPDEGNGALERALTILLPAVGFAVSFVTAREWRRDRATRQGQSR
jgi:hypothetical protein